METSNNIIAKMSSWHSTAVNQARIAELEAKKAAEEAREAANKERYKASLDSFTANFEALSQLDGKAGDYDSRPGNVKTSTQSLQKTDEGFVMTLITYQPVPGLGAVFPVLGGAAFGLGKPIGSGLKTMETYTVNEQGNTISYTKMQESPLGEAGLALPRGARRGEQESPLGDNPSVLETIVLDLNRGTLTDLTPAASPSLRFRESTSLLDSYRLDPRTNGTL